MDSEFAAIVLAGGRGRRLGGADKPGLVVGGKTLLDRVLEAVADAVAIAVVGRRRPTAMPVRWTTEKPIGTGPVAAVAAGMAALGYPLDDMAVAVLAADSVGLRADTITRLRAELSARPNTDGVVLRDANGRSQWLVGVWRMHALRRALPADPTDHGLAFLFSRLSIASVPERPGESADVDTPEDLRRARSRWEEPGH